MSAKVIQLLNEARSRELTAIMTYLAQHYELDDQDFGKLAEVMKKTGIAEMKHAEACAERILFLEGAPTTKPDAPIKRGLKMEEMVVHDMALEDQAVKMYNKAIQVCIEEGDGVSQDLFEKLLKDEEEHYKMFEDIRDHLKEMGAAYKATLVG